MIYRVLVNMKMSAVVVNVMESKMMRLVGCLTLDLDKLRCMNIAIRFCFCMSDT